MTSRKPDHSLRPQKYLRNPKESEKHLCVNDVDKPEKEKNSNEDDDFEAVNKWKEQVEKKQIGKE